MASGGVAKGSVLSGGDQTVYGAASGTDILANSYDQVFGVTTGTIVNNDGADYVYSGGVTSGSVLSGGYEGVAGVTSGTIVSSGGDQYVSVGGIADGSVIDSSGLQVVAGVASITIVSGGGRQYISSGGVASGTEIFSGSYDQVYGSTTGTAVSSGGNEYVYSGGAPTGTLISSGGVGYVFSGGTATGTIVSSGGVEYVNSGGVISGLSIEAGGSAFIYLGGTASGSLLRAGAYQVVSGTAVGTEVFDSSYQNVYGTATATILYSGGDENVRLGGIATGTIVSTGAYQYVSSGGIASGTVVLSGGELIISSGGIASAASVGSDGYVNAHSGGATIDDVIGSGGYESVSSGGVASATTVNSGGVLVELAGGLLVGTVNNGGVVVSTGVLLTSGYVYLSATGGTATGEDVTSGERELVLSGGITSASMIESSGTQFIDAGGVASGTFVRSGGFESVLSGGMTYGSVISSGGFEEVLSGGTATSTTVQSGGVLLILPGGQESGTVNSGGSDISSGLALLSGNTLLSFSTGTLSGASIGSGLDALVQRGGLLSAAFITGGGSATIYSGRLASASQLSGQGREFIYSGGVSISAVVGAASYEFVQSGGIASGAAVMGFEIISSGGVADGTTLSSGGEALVSAGGVTNDTVVNGGGFEDVLSGGVAVGTVLSGGGQENVNSGGLEVVSAGASVDAYIASGGALAIDGQIVSSGAVFVASAVTGVAATVSGAYLVSGARLEAVSATVLQGGQIEAALGGIISSTTVSAGGIEIISSGSVASGSVIAFGGAIDISYLSAVGGSATINPITDLLTVVEGASTYTETLFGDYATDYLAAVADSSGSGTLVVFEATPCFCRGTRIATASDDVNVEDLQIGDLLRTHSGALRPIRWIGRRSYCQPFIGDNAEIIPVRIAAGALADACPARDLIVSPLHAMLLDGVLIPAGLLVNGVSIQRCPELDPIDYFHIEMASHDIILAEGAPAETFVDCDSRLMFHNAAEFARLYPDDITPKWRFCAPRVERGLMLDQVRQAIAARAGLAPAADADQGGTLLGYLEHAAHHRVSGWAWQPDHPEAPAVLEIIDGGGVIARVVANLPRDDVRAAGYGRGLCGFELAVTLSPDRLHEISVRRCSDHMALPGPSRLLQPLAADPLAADRLLAAVCTSASTVHDETALETLFDKLTQATDHVRAARWRHRAQAPADTKHALVIDDRMPVLERDAGSNALLSHIEVLRRLGYRVAFVASQEMGAPRSPDLQALDVDCHAASASGSVEEVLRREGGRFDLVYLHRVANAAAYLGLARRHCPRAQVIYSVADLSHVRLARQAAVQQRPAVAAAARAARRVELLAVQQADAVITHSPVEAAWLQREVGSANIHTVRWHVTPPPGRVAFAERRGVAFIGGHGHAPNQDAMHWLMSEVMPAVWQQDPDIECLVVGQDWSPAMFARADSRLKLIGPVANLADVLNRVRLTVAPLRFGAGLKGKVISSLAAGVPCVMSTIAAEGLPTFLGLEHLVAADADGIAAAILRYHHDEAASARLSNAGRAMMERHFALSEIIAAMRAAITPAAAVSRRATG